MVVHGKSDYNGIVTGGEITVSDDSQTTGTGGENHTENNAGTSIGITTKAINILDTAQLMGHAKATKTNTGVKCRSCNISIASGAKLFAQADGGYTGNSARSHGLIAGNHKLDKGAIKVKGSLVATAGNATDQGNARGIMISNTVITVSDNGSVIAKGGKPAGSGATSYGLLTFGSNVTINGGGFLASGGDAAVEPSDASINVGTAKLKL